MEIRVVARYESTLPDDDDHPYRTGPWRPNHVERVATSLPVVGDLPDDLEGTYLRNTENPLHDSLGRYHPFDGDGMVHAVSFGAGEAEYRNRFVRTRGFEAELAAGRPLWAGLMEPPSRSERDGWGARTRLKDASSTDVLVHNGRALTTHYQCGDAYQLDPRTLEQLGAAPWVAELPGGWGISAHPKVDPATGELLCFGYSTEAPFLQYGVVDAQGLVAHHAPVELPGPRLPHDMAFTERFAIFNDCPLFWDPDLLARGVHAVRWFPELPTRLAVVPRRGAVGDVTWFEADPTYVLHWINAYEDGDTIVLDGFHQEHPAPGPRPDDDQWQALFRFIDTDRLRPRPHRWRLDLTTGTVREDHLDERILEFGMIDQRRAGRPYRHTYTLTSPPGWFLFDGIVKLDVEGGPSQSYRYPEGTYISEAPFAPRVGSTAEDDGYVLTLVTDMNADRSECHVFDARDVAAGPVARVGLPARISSGTHACWWDGGS